MAIIFYHISETFSTIVILFFIDLFMVIILVHIYLFAFLQVKLITVSNFST